MYSYCEATKKISYDTKNTAVKAIKGIGDRKRHKTDMTIYRCESCSGFHISKMNLYMPVRKKEKGKAI